jgi:hypothetical protein
MSTAIKDDYVAPVFLTDEARDLNDRFYLILNNLVASFPNAKFKPSDKQADKTNKAIYDENMGHMLSLQNDYFMYKNTVLRASEELLNDVKIIDDKINMLDAENKELKSKLNELAGSSHSAEGMLDDSQITRNQLFYGNIMLFIIMVSGGLLYYKKVRSAQ